MVTGMNVSLSGMNHTEENAPAVHWAWVILVVCFVNLFVNYGIRLGYGVVLPEMIRTLGLTRTQAGDIFNAYLLVYICLSPFIGYLTDRMGARRVISFFGILLGLGTFFLGTAKSFWQACLFFGIAGMGASAMWAPIMTIVQGWFALRKRGMALGLLSTGFGLGYAVEGRMFPVIVEHWSWRYCWYFLGIAALVMVVVNGFALRSKPEDIGLQPWGSRPGGGSPSPVSTKVRSPRGRLSEILTTSRFWIIGFSYMIAAFSLYPLTTYMVDYARYNLGFPFERASLLATVHGLGQIVGVLTIPLLSDYIGRRRTLALNNLLIAASIACLLLSGTHELALFFSMGIFGVCYGVTFPMYGACGGDYFRKEIMGTVIGAWTPLYGLGAIGGNRLGGYLRDVTGSFTLPFLVTIFTALIASVLMLCLRVDDKRK
jgi:sugar phosphate permease